MMPNPFPVHRVAFGALAVPTPTSLSKLDAADKKSVAIATGIGGLIGYAVKGKLGAVLGALGGAAYGVYRANKSAAAAASMSPAPPPPPAQFVDMPISTQPAPSVVALPALPPASVDQPVVAPPPPPPPGAASAPAPAPPPPPPPDPSVSTQPAPAIVAAAPATPAPVVAAPTPPVMSPEAEANYSRQMYAALPAPVQAPSAPAPVKRRIVAPH
jgi:hypothetical protein